MAERFASTMNPASEAQSSASMEDPLQNDSPSWTDGFTAGRMACLIALFFIPLNKLIHRQDSPNLPAQNTASLSVTDAPPPANPIAAPSTVAVQSQPNMEAKSEPNQVKIQNQTADLATDYQPVVPVAVAPKITPQVKEPVQAAVPTITSQPLISWLTKSAP